MDSADPMSTRRPHMKKLYGDRLRKDGGLTKTLKNVADKTLSTKGGKRGSEIRRVVQEVKGSIEKVEEKVTEAVEEFLDHGELDFEPQSSSGEKMSGIQ